MNRSLLIASVVSAFAPLARAHDVWLEAEPARADAPRPVKLYLFRGEHFTEAEPVTVRSRERYSRFEVHSAEGRRDLRAALREDELAVVSLPAYAGARLVAVESRPIAIELPAKKWNEYLLSERLIDVLAERADRGTEDAAGRELYSRSLKVVVSHGPAAASRDAIVTRPVGQELEIVPAANPCALAAGAGLTVQVLFRGQPLPRRAVLAANRHQGVVTTESVRTDAEGKARFRIGRPGDWMVRLVHMERAREPGHDWRSYWSSLTFSLGE